MWWTLAAAGLALLAAATADSCSQILQPGECVLTWGCQWCASEEESAPADGARCRTRPAGLSAEALAADTKAWCPGSGPVGAALDPPEAHITTNEDGNQVVETRKGTFPITFLLKTRSAAEKIEKDFQVWTNEEVELCRDYFKCASKAVKIGEREMNVTVSIEVLKCPDKEKLEQLFVRTEFDEREFLLKLHCDAGAEMSSCPRPREPSSRKCNGNGARRCGACECETGWGGLNCEEKICKQSRDDIGFCQRGCNNNGKCDECHRKCVCDARGEPYFEDERCWDFCDASESCAVCLKRGGPGGGGGGGGRETTTAPLAQHGDRGIFEDNTPCYSLCEERKIHNVSSGSRPPKLNWKQCTVEVDGCTLQYSGSKQGIDERFIELGDCVTVVAPPVPGIGAAGGGPDGSAGGLAGKESGSGGGGSAGGGSGSGREGGGIDGVIGDENGGDSNGTAGTENKLVVAGGVHAGDDGQDNGGAIVGWVLAALVLAALALAAALLLYRARASPERDAFADMQYDIMESEANQGVNPLYRPPITKYCNPLYATKE